MSTAVNSSFLPNTTTNPALQWSQHRFKVSEVSSSPSFGSFQVQTSAPSTSRIPPAEPGNKSTPLTNGVSVRPPKRLKKRTEGENEIIRQTADRFASCLAADHISALYPDVDSPFIDATDVVNRLLPYHIFQQPEEDLETAWHIDKKGKRKATDTELAEEVAETKFAIRCAKRHRALEEKFRKIRINADSRSAPDDQAYILAQLILEADRSETVSLSNELRNARTELDRLEREKRFVPVPARPTYYSHIAATQSQYYRAYPYAYAHPYGPQPTLPYHPPAPATETTNTAPTNSPANTNAGGAIPVQLPVSSLPALHALGIVPVPAASLPPPDQPQPPAVLRGSTSNGTMLSLEINVSLLQSAQMNGLALVLNSLMSRGVASSTEPGSKEPVSNGGTAAPTSSGSSS